MSDKPVIVFATWKEACDAYYKANQCDSDDVDKEEGRIMRWLEENNYEVNE